MKINKNSKELLEAKKIVEADDADLGAETKETSDGVETKVSVELDKDAKPATKRDFLKIQNSLTKMLDQAFDDAKFALEEENYDFNCNILVVGLPGSSKTATVKNWCKQNKCNLDYLDAKNPDLAVLLGGAGSIDKTDPKHPVILQAYSDALAKLDRPNSVLFLDELNRQIKEYLRGSLLTLVADRSVAGIDKTKSEEEQNGFRRFPNLLFTVAAINPPKANDKGATELNDAEKRRFYFRCIFNSEVPATKSFLLGYYDDLIENYAKKHPERNAAFIERVNSMCLRQWIGLKIITNENFRFTSEDEYMNSDSKTKLLSQSVVTELVDHSRGNLDRMKNDINASDLSKEDKQMLIKIIDGLVLPNVDSLRKQVSKRLGIDLGETSADAIEEPKEETPKTSGEGDDFDFKPSDFDEVPEDDADFDDDGTGATGASATKGTPIGTEMSEDELTSDVSSTVDSWL